MRAVAAVILGLLSIVPLLAVGIYHLEAPRLKEQAFSDLQAIAILKAGQIEAWLDERRGDAVVLGASPGLIEDAVRATAHGDEQGARQRIVERLATLQRAYSYDGFLLVDGSAQPIVAIGADEASAAAPVRRALQTAFDTTQVATTDLYRSDSGRVHLDWVAPLVREIDGRRRAVGAVILDTPVERVVFPLIQSWPTPSPSAETLLVRRQGDAVLYLNELRHRTATALLFSQPLDDPDLPAARAVLAGTPQVIAGKDYRGVAVLAATRPVSGTPWHLVAKVDRDEVLAPLRNLVFWVSLVATCAILVVSLLIVLLWRQQLRTHQLELATQSLEKDRLVRLFFDLPFVGMTTLAADSRRWLRFNDRLCEILGYPREELLELSWIELTHRDDLAGERIQFERLLSGASNGFQTDKRFLRKDGRVINVTADVRTVRHEDGRVDFFVATVQDITARLQAEGFAQELLDNVNQGFVVYDRALRVIVWNRFLERTIGLPREAAIGRHLDELFPDARRLGIDAHLQRALAGEVVVADEFVPRLRGTTKLLAAESVAERRDDPRLFWTLSSYAPHRNVNGDIDGVLVNVVDMTTLKRSQDALLASNEELRQLSRYLERVREEERVRIARELHDDLGSTLTAVKWAIAMAIERAQEAALPGDAQLAHASQLLDSAVDTMRRIISDLRPSVLDHLGVWTAIEWYAGQIGERTGLRCDVTLSPEVVALEVDPERATAMFRIVQEALNNVVRHARASHAEIRVRCDAGAVMIAVEDDGVGTDDGALTKTESWGLLGMQERAARFDGEIKLSCGATGGTILALRMPF
ncbi:PAS domain S-box protein [Accumulibacter sp.]|uniref:sensor histidine kinase n=1 Tax=Accumulibacter sp. TaxID=2053492 RepID=UPI001AC17231|nr:PAS domain S-box protein [Accumulibacter sp.]MBN8455398.1 PAS domain S-box protein [Accumulibacter sp.]